MHRDRQCLQAAIRRRAFARALRIAGSPDTSAVVEYIETFENEENEEVPDHVGKENR